MSATRSTSYDARPVTPITFGTEGWRAILGDAYTVENVTRVARAIAAYLQERVPANTTVRVGVGFDTRFLSDRFAQVVAEVLAGAGCEVLLAQRSTPTPSLSTFVRHEQLHGGVMITASHNPPHFNGIKVKAPDGGSIGADATARIEQLVDQYASTRMPLAEAMAQQRVRQVDLLPGHMAEIRKFVRLNLIRRSPLRVLVDAMHGTGDHLIEQLAGSTRCRVTTLHGDRDPLFGGHAPEPIPGYLTELLRDMKRGRYHLGLATDGDADRIGAARPDGKFINPGQILCLILLHLINERKMRGAVVTTISNISWIPLIAKEYGLKVHETPVGFKHIAKLMREDHILMGGEESGGIGITAYLPERDGVLLGLLLMEVLAVQRKPLLTLFKELERKYGRFAYGRVDLHFSESQRDTLMRRLSSEPPTTLAGKPIADTKTYDGLKLIGRDRQWALFRLSGTEPILRIYAEAPTDKEVQRILTWGQHLAKP